MSEIFPTYLLGLSGALTDISSTDIAIRRLEESNFKLIDKSSVSRSYQRFCGTDDQKIEEITNLCKYSIENPGKILGLGIRGGYGLIRLLPRIDFNLLSSAIESGLVLAGHSDFTTLSLALYAKTSKQSLLGPMLSPDFMNNEVSQFTLNSFCSCLANRKFEYENKSSQEFIKEEIEISNGLLWGGNLTIINSLLGTSYFPPHEAIRNGILFLEDVNEHPYRIERMLTQLILSGVMEHQKAIILGQFTEYKLTEYDRGYNITNAIMNIQTLLKSRGLEIPIFHNLPFGHVFDKLTIPVGAKCNLSGNSNGFKLLANW